MRILVVDDEKNIRLMLTECLQGVADNIDLAVTGEEAIEKVDGELYDIVFLDMKMPGMGGMEALRRIKVKHPNQTVVMITAYGTIETAVEAMKLGAVDYLRKPFTPNEVRSLANQIAERPHLSSDDKETSESLIEMAKHALVQRKPDEAMIYLQRVVAIDPTKPEPFNLLGLLLEVKGDLLAAQKMYRAALSLDPTYRPAQDNLHKTVEWGYRDDNIEAMQTYRETD